MGVVPSIHEYVSKSPINTSNGMAGAVAVVGAFDTEETNPQLFLNLDDAQAAFGDDPTFNGCKVLPQLFNGASSVLAVNVTTWTDETADKTMTVQKLTEALAKIKVEDFDLLYVAETLSSTFLPIISQYLDDKFECKSPAGYVGGITGQASALIDAAEAAGEHCFGLICQTFEVNGEELDLIESAAYYTALLAARNVGYTMTQKVVNGVTGVTPEYSFENGDSGTALVGAGITILACKNRNNNNFIVVNSEQPNNLDLYVNRVINYVNKEMDIQPFLGERNRPATLDLVKQEVEYHKNRCIDVLDLLKDIEYTVTKKDAQTAEIHVTRLVFDGILTRINVYYNVVVE